MKGQARRDYEAMVKFARSAGILIVFITYPLETSEVSAAAKAVIREVAGRHDVAVIESLEAVLRVPLGEREFIWAAHPTGPIYRAIARDVADAILAPSA